MASVPGSNALVPNSTQTRTGPAFAQQGSVDWVALGQTQWSASVAILGRLSSAGIEPLTAAVGQAICSRLPLGAHGEKLLSESMAGLKVCSSFGNMVWFGVGVRHILHVLVQTSQGASLVALCAALSESHNVVTSALVLYEMTKRYGGPSDLTPSLAQWQALVKVCSSVFCHTTFGIRVDQMLRLVGCDLRRLTWRLLGHPKDLADIILAMGNVAAGGLLEIQIIGGVECSWVIVFADFVLGLRVSVRESNGRTLFTNFDASTAETQVDVEINGAYPQGSITCLGRTFTLRDGVTLINDLCDSSEDYTSAYRFLEPFRGGRLPWDTMLAETFDTVTEKLLTPQQTQQESPDLELQRSDMIGEAFVNFFIGGAVFYTCFTEEYTRYSSVHDFVLQAIIHISEMRPLKQALLRAATQWDQYIRSGLNFYSKFELALRNLSRRCRCTEHKMDAPDEYPVYAKDAFCLLGVAATILVMTYLLGRLKLAVPLSPRRSGILTIYNDVKGRYKNKNPPKLSHTIVQNLLKPTLWGDILDLRSLFSMYMTLFSSEQSFELAGRPTLAISDGKVYCFIETVRELSDHFERASVVNVGAGSIQVESRLHNRILDGQGHMEALSDYEAFRVGTYRDNIPAIMTHDTTSPELRAEAVVEDSINLSFWYRLSSKHGQTVISPGKFINNLQTAIGYAVYAQPQSWDDKPCTDSTSASDVASCQDITVVDGEGLLARQFQAPSNIVIRPHCGNMLGRCVALVNSTRTVAMLNETIAMLNKDEDLVQFARAINARRARSGKEEMWILIF